MHEIQPLVAGQPSFINRPMSSDDLLRMRSIGKITHLWLNRGRGQIHSNGEYYQFRLSNLLGGSRIRVGEKVSFSVQRFDSENEAIVIRVAR
jgi:hypothetical protein